MTNAAEIVGTWQAVRNPFDANEELFLQFDPSGKLTQTTRKGGEQQIIFLTYRFEDGLLVRRHRDFQESVATILNHENE